MGGYWKRTFTVSGYSFERVSKTQKQENRFVMFLSRNLNEGVI